MIGRDYYENKKKAKEKKIVVGTKIPELKSTRPYTFSAVMKASELPCKNRKT